MGVLSAARVFLAEAPFVSPESGRSEDQAALIRVIDDAMTSWWAQAVAIALYALVATLLFRSLRRWGVEGETVSRRRATAVALVVLAALAAMVVLAATDRAPLFIVLEFLILFAVTVYLSVRSVPAVTLGAGAAIMWVVSPRRRREMREEAASRPDARERGVALERVLDDAEAELHGETGV